MRQESRLGSLEAGKDADLILLDLNSLAFTPRNDLSRHLVYCENGSSVRLTMVAGSIVFRNGKLQRVDEEEIKREIEELWPDYRRDCDLNNKRNHELIDVYKAVCRRCAATDVGFNRWIDLH